MGPRFAIARDLAGLRRTRRGLAWNGGRTGGKECAARLRAEGARRARDSADFQLRALRAPTGRTWRGLLRPVEDRDRQTVERLVARLRHDGVHDLTIRMIA